MCLPAAALPVLAVASGVMQASGALMAGQQANSQSKADADAARRNAALEIESAHTSYEIGKDERRDFWRKIGQVKGQNRASMAANNIEVDFGTAARIQDDTQMLANEDAISLYRNIEERTRGHHINAANFVQAAKAARAQGKAAVKASYWQAATSLVGAASQAAGYKAKMGTSSAKN